MDAINVIGIELWLKLGCTPAERAFPQRVELDVRLEGDWAAAGRWDDLARSVDYAAVTAGLRRLLEKKPRRLLETVAEDAARWVLKRTPARAVGIKARKRALPGIRFAEVEIYRAAAR
ncbi:MAG: dihydroneopterin aldolase [Elusimicrobia bacterium]|jgi:dihydroneopterin aldolase|nr:MAG: dihydroneopterin aldolase [Elusimicrobiota bacterium]